MSERLSVADARSAIVSGRDEDLQVNMDALLAARDAEWRAAVERVREWFLVYAPFERTDRSIAVLDALLATMEVPHDGQ